MLIIFNCLPGSGKSTVAKLLSQKINAVYLRVDTVEQAIRSVSEQNKKIGPEGYFVLYELARENLQLGATVVTDSVNDINLIRNTFRDVAISLNVPFLEVEILCSDMTQHRYRVENRISDIPGLTTPNWEQVQCRNYEPWEREHLQLDTAILSAHRMCRCNYQKNIVRLKRIMATLSRRRLNTSVCFPLKAGLELKADGLTNTFLHSEWAVIVNSQIFNVSMTIRRAGETLR